MLSFDLWFAPYAYLEQVSHEHHDIGLALPLNQCNYTGINALVASPLFR